ncbi:MAG: DsrE/DsrF/DrsH-like family protein [Theionarchaea archaeon]|nr:DsrE/DsrF/DrsH-like family protein [Theionarchaea archaeon]
MKKASIIVFSGDLDKAMAALVIATGAAASGMDVTLFFTFWGLNILKKGGAWRGEGFMGKMFNLMARGGGAIGPSRLNMLGIGRWMMKRMMRQKNVKLPTELLSEARDLGVKFLACEMSMRVMGVRKEDLLDVDDIVGVATYIQNASDSEVTLFI